MTYSDDYSYASDSVPQKSVTQDMRSEPHGVHNYDEYRQVMSVAATSSENIHYWAHYGIIRTLHRRSAWTNAALRANLGQIPDDEIDLCLDYVRAVGPIFNEFHRSSNGREEFFLRVCDHTASEKLLSLDAYADQNVLHWAKIGLVEGLKSQRFMCGLIMSGEMGASLLELFDQDPAVFIERCDKLLVDHGMV